MDTKLLRQLLEDIKAGDVNVDDAMRRLRSLPYEDVGFAKLDNHRQLRNGVAEVVFCQGKTTQQTIEILKRLREHNNCILATRADRCVYEAVCEHISDIEYYEAARIIVAGKPERSGAELAGDDQYVMVLCGGTADIPVAEEAAVTATALGSRVERAYDVGVAGLHRLLDQKERILGANVLIVLAGMEGALASVVGGLVDRPVIAVPTSVGYGASFGGLAALLAMLNSCAAGVSVVNIDNGFGAGYLAHMINSPHKI
ncbi:MAG: nickel pincer cofactor biosynthesis protein LarB [Armatimonadetes bacterium]|nr:nickel pincer cofactor biosynthesis protein LarB [Armatimonadota bacterium]